jgi:hypothetical protein
MPKVREYRDERPVPRRRRRGVAPFIAPPSGGGTTYSLDPAAGNCGYQGGTGGLVGTAGTVHPITAFLLAEGCTTWGAVGAESAWSRSPGLNGSLRFYATDPTLIEVRCYQTTWSGNPATVRMFIDGVYQATALTLPNTSSYGWNTVPGTLPTDGQPHEFRLMGPAFFFNQLRVTGGIVRTTPLLPLPLLTVYGDSRANATGVTDGTLSFNLRIAGPLGMQVYSSGASSSTVRYVSGGTAAQTTSSGEYRTDDVLLPANAWPPAKVFLLVYGYNDFGMGGSYNSALFIASFANMLRKLIIGNQDAVIVVEKVFKGLTSENLTTINADIQTAIAQVGNPNVYFKTGIYDNYDGSGGIHPDDAHCAVIAPAIVSDVQSVMVATTPTYVINQVRNYWFFHEAG